MVSPSSPSFLSCYCSWLLSFQGHYPSQCIPRIIPKYISIHCRVFGRPQQTNVAVDESEIKYSKREKERNDLCSARNVQSAVFWGLDLLFLRVRYNNNNWIKKNRNLHTTKNLFINKFTRCYPLRLHHLSSLSLWGPTSPTLFVRSFLEPLLYGDVVDMLLAISIFSRTAQSVNDEIQSS